MEPLISSPKPTVVTTPPDKPNHLWLIVGGVLIVIAAILIAMMLQQNKSERLPVANVQPPQKQAFVRITATGFVPKELSVEPGTVIVWINEDSKVHHIESNPFPEATEHPDLNSKEAINTGATYTYKADKSGEYNYHDRLNPASNGRIIVK